MQAKYNVFFLKPILDFNIFRIDQTSFHISDIHALDHSN